MAEDVKAVKLTAAQQAWVEQEIKRHLTEAKQQLVPVDSKPQHVDDLRKVWRKTKEHYQAQVLRFLGVLGTVIGQQVFNDFVNGKPLFDGLGSPRAVAVYVAGAVYLAWKQYRPSLEAKAVDSAPGATIVPAQVGVETTPEVVVGVEEVADGGGGEGDAAP